MEKGLRSPDFFSSLSYTGMYLYKHLKTCSSSEIVDCWRQWFKPTILAVWEAKMERFMIQGQPQQKVSETPMSTNKLGTMMHACHPSYKGSINRRMVQAGWSKNVRPYLKNSQGKERWECLQW
jgi:hypothetical protein